MKMTFRWYGENNDTVTLEQIRQIPGIKGVVWALHDIPVGDIWPIKRIFEMKNYADKYNLNIDVVESINIHEDIKLGLPTREKYIENFKQTIKNLAKVGVKVICYNFMPVFDWTRTELFKSLEDGSTALFYENAKVKDINPKDFMKKMLNNAQDYTLPGWEFEKLEKLEFLFKMYKNINDEQLWDNLKYFLEQIIPVAEKNDIKMAIHPDDPPWSIFGLPRLITCEKNLQKFFNLVDSPHNGLTLCTGSLGVNLENNIPRIIKKFARKIHFVHIRNVKVFNNGDFTETSHRTCDGSLDIYQIIKSFYEIQYKGYVRPDHGRNIWNEKCRPGYGLYDRALGVMYILGIWDSLNSE